MIETSFYMERELNNGLVMQLYYETGRNQFQIIMVDRGEIFHFFIDNEKLDIIIDMLDALKVSFRLRSMEINNGE